MSQCHPAHDARVINYYFKLSMQLHSAGLRCLARWARRGCPVPGITWIRSRCRRQPVGDSPDVISAVFIRSSRRPRGRRTGQKQITRAPSNVQSSQDAASDGESTMYTEKEFKCFHYYQLIISLSICQMMHCIIY